RTCVVVLFFPCFYVERGILDTVFSLISTYAIDMDHYIYGYYCIVTYVRSLT
ncbi:hypothetical protein K438DRAFT_1825225, partial [Mycena galopus ATCC 62051]